MIGKTKKTKKTKSKLYSKPFCFFCLFANFFSLHLIKILFNRNVFLTAVKLQAPNHSSTVSTNTSLKMSTPFFISSFSIFSLSSCELVKTLRLFPFLTIVPFSFSASLFTMLKLFFSSILHHRKVKNKIMVKNVISSAS